VLLLLLPQVLSRAYSKNGTALPAPIETHVTRWGKDPLAYGAYSYYATGNPKNITGETPSHRLCHSLAHLVRAPCTQGWDRLCRSIGPG
jgi:hypothetical protein